MEKIDARHRECPAPVLMTRDRVEKQAPQKVTVVVSNDASRQNVARYLASAGYQVTDEAVGEDFHVMGTRTDQAPGSPGEAPAAVLHDAAQGRKIMVMVTTDRMGFGDDALGLKLMANFIRTLKEMGPDLWRLVFVNNGVKLTTQTSDVAEDLVRLECEGVVILVCGTCLEHYGLSEAKRAGQTTNMLDIVTAMHLADKVISM